MATKAIRARGAERLTDTAIKAWLRTAAEGDSLHDGAGLYLRRRGGAAFWSLRQINPITGQRTWAGLFPGVPYPAASLADARRDALQARLRAAKAPTDLVRERSAAIAAKRAEAAAAALEASRRVTVLALFEQWAATDLAPRVGADGRRMGRKDSGAYTRDQFKRRVFPRLGEVAVKDVRRADLMAILDAIKAEGKATTANRVYADLKQMLDFALKRELIDRNPLDTITKRDVGGPETARARVLSADEARALAEALPGAGMAPSSVLAVWLILATACRVGEAMAARWDDVDLKARTWHLPETKNQREHTIHLSAFAVRQFEALASIRDAELAERRTADPDAKPVPWVFPASSGEDAVCVKSLGKQLADRQRPAERRMKNRTKRTESLVLAGGRWTAHDLRRTAATMMAELGVSGDVIDECLNHKIESQVRRVYIRDRRLAEQARAFDALGTKLEQIIGGHASATNVVELRTSEPRTPRLRVAHEPGVSRRKVNSAPRRPDRHEP